MECGERPEVFAPTVGNNGDPLWPSTSRWLARQLERMLYEEGIPRPCHALVAARVRQNICDQHGVPSMRHLPGGVCQREVVALLLACQLHGAHEVLQLQDIKDRLQEEADMATHAMTPPHDAA